MKLLAAYLKHFAIFLQPAAWLFASLGPWVRYLYLIRVQLLVLMAALFMPLLAWKSGARTLLLGAYDLEKWYAAMAVGFCLVMLLRGLMAQKKLVDDYGLRRFGGPVLGHTGAFDIIWQGLGIAACLLNATLILAASQPELRLQFHLALGLLAGFSFYRIPVQYIGPNLKLSSNLRRRLGKWLFYIFKGPVPGFIESERDDEAFSEENVILSKGHGMALCFGLMLLAVFILMPASFINPLVAVFLLLAILSNALGFLAFVVDRYRVPVIVYVIAFCGLMTLYSESDHFYPIKPLSETLSPDRPSPASVLGKAAKEKRGIIIVTAAGGGIQSAAWVTEVLNQLGKASANPENFHRNIRLISGVSGGSVGALHYAHAFDSNVPERFQNAAQAAAASSLSAATLGLIREDLIRAIAPWYYAFRKDILSDRCSLLEKAWQKNGDSACFKMNKTFENATLHKWGQDAGTLTRPALIFNSTITETGERMALSTVPRSLETRAQEELHGSRINVGDFEFFDRYKADIQMTTAARLSATFPLVSAGARPAVVSDWGEKAQVRPGPKHRGVFPKGGNMLHAVDGGYFENSGMVGALEWLENGLTELSEAKRSSRLDPMWEMPQEILILELDAFAKDESRDNHVDKDVPPGGLLADLISPLVTLANVRNSGQSAFSNITLRQFQQSWKSQNVRVNHVRIKPAMNLVESSTKAPAFHIQADWKHAPLSWHLRETEKQAIHEMAGKVIAQVLVEKASLTPDETSHPVIYNILTGLSRDTSALTKEVPEKPFLPTEQSRQIDPGSNRALLNHFTTNPHE